MRDDAYLGFLSPHTQNRSVLCLLCWTAFIPYERRNLGLGSSLHMLLETVLMGFATVSKKIRSSLVASV